MSRATRHWPIWLVGLAVATVVAGGTVAVAVHVTTEGVRNRISQKIHGKYHVENLQIKVVPFASDYWTQQGRFQAIVVSADRVTRKGIDIRKVYIKAFDVTLDIAELYKEGDVETTSRRNTTLSVRVYKGDLNKLLAKKKSTIQNLHVEFQDHKLVVTGKYQLLFGYNLRMVGKLQVKNRRQVDFVPTAASVNNIPLPTGPLRQVLSKLNPLVDFHELPLRPSIDKVEIKDDYILVNG